MSVCWSVICIFLKWREVTLPCYYRRTCWLFFLPYDKPKLERTKPPTERDPPVPVVNGRLGVGVLEVEGVDHQGLGQLEPVPDPHGADVKVDEHPLVGVHVEGVGVLDALY